MDSIVKLAKDQNTTKANIAYQYFESQGCKLLDEYVGTMKKMKYICSCGRHSEISWNKFSQGRRCGYCGTRHKKYSQEEVTSFFEQHGCKLLDEYINGTTKVRYICKCGKEAHVTFQSFLHQNQNCFRCGRDKIRGSGNPSWVEDRELKRLNELFRKKCYKALRSSLLVTKQNKRGRTRDCLGYTPKELKEHIFNHPNWGKVKDQNWHLDHVFPISAFVKKGITDLKIINHLSNLQPLSETDNIKKNDSYDEEPFNEYLKNLNFNYCRIM